MSVVSPSHFSLTLRGPIRLLSSLDVGPLTTSPVNHYHAANHGECTCAPHKGRVGNDPHQEIAAVDSSFLNIVSNNKLCHW